MSKTQLQFVRDPHPSPVSADQRAALLKNPGFGRVFSDHMVTIRYHDFQGWHDARIGPRARSRWIRPAPCCITRRSLRRA